MTQPPASSPALASLAADPPQIRAATLWAAIPPDDRRRAIALAVTGDRQLRSVLIAAIRKTPRYKSFRADSFNGWSADQIGGAVQAPGVLPQEGIEAGLIALHLGDRSAMLAAFLDSLGIAHDNGTIRDTPDPLSLSDADLARAADDLAARYPADQVTVYMMTLMVVDPGLWGGLGSWLSGSSGAARPNS
ncbi:MAG: hypothetical protein ABI637_11225 [Gemmatimonadota bacterium]